MSLERRSVRIIHPAPKARTIKQRTPQSIVLPFLRFPNELTSCLYMKLGFLLASKRSGEALCSGRNQSEDCAREHRYSISCHPPPTEMTKENPLKMFELPKGFVCLDRLQNCCSAD